MAVSALLHLAPARRATYHKTRKGANKALNWPYPLTAAAAKNSSIHPDRLVAAGFYCTPTADDPTVTTCFLCEVVVGEWEEGEEPLYRHQAAAEEAGLSCGWATVCQASWGEQGVEGRDKRDWEEAWGEDGVLHPRGDTMSSAREETFRLGWPHEGVKGVPTKEEIAAAGWYFRPGNADDSNDQCACTYCGRIIEGWEAGDDPVALHKRKVGLKCPFFLAPSPSASAKAPAPSAKTPSSSRSRSAAPTPAREAEHESEVEEQAPKTAKRGKKALTISGASSSASKSRKGKKAVKTEDEADEEAAEEEEDDAVADAPEEDDAEEPEPEPVKKTKAKAKPAAKGRTRSGSVASTTATRSTRARGATPAQSEADEPAEEVSILKKSTRSRTATTSAAALSKSTRSRAATASKVEVDVTVEIETPAPAKGKKGKKAAPAPAPEPEEEVEEVGGEADDSIAQLAFIANAALEAEQLQEETKDVPAKAKVKRAASVKREKVEKEKKATPPAAPPAADVEAAVEDDAPLPPPSASETMEKVASPPPAAPPPVSILAAAAAAPLSPPPAGISPTSRTSIPRSASGRQIRPLPSKVNASKSPSATSLNGMAGGSTTPKEPVPPLPLPPPAVAAPPPPAPPVVSVLDPSLPFTPPSNPFTPGSSALASLLPPPTAEELANLTTGEWYALCGRRLQERFAAEADAMKAQLEARIGAGRERLGRMVQEAKQREEREEAEAQARDAERRRAKAERKKAATPGKSRGVKVAAEGSARKMR
ncbi:hypothetical protein JCM10213_009129 [Rhodosporidiobolus nylandii]